MIFHMPLDAITVFVIVKRRVSTAPPAQPSLSSLILYLLRLLNNLMLGPY